MIVKPDDKEAKLLDRALSYVADYVDEICITQAGKEPNSKVSKVIEKYKGKESFFKWVYDFSAARNFNFNQTTGDYIFWIDADDVIRGAEKLKPLVKRMEKDAIDSVVMNYLYDFTKEGKKKICTVKHLKTRITKRDVVEWIGEIHEDFVPLRELNPIFTDEIEILHITTNERAKESSERNTDIARKYAEAHPKDPRGDWLIANALMAENKEEDAIKYYEKFIGGSNSHEEIFIAFLRLGDIRKSITDYLQALALRPDYPDAYLKIGELYANQQEWDLAKRFILTGLRVKTPEREIIVYNPRDYDFNPLMILANVYMQTKEYKNAILVLERCKDIMPEHEKVKRSLKLIKKYQSLEKKVDKVIKKAQGMKKEEIKKFLESQEEDIISHPKLSVFRNMYFIKETSTGKDIAYYCSYTDSVWHPESDKLGGSEEAVVNLSKNWVKKGYNVTVFNNCGKTKVYDGVTYKPHYLYNPRDKYDYLILWRHPRPVDFQHNSEKIFVDVHDVLPSGEFTKDRLEKIDKIFLKTEAHRKLFPNVPDEKISIIPNGLDPEPFKTEIERNPYLILNTSSPERHLDATLDIFEKLIKEQPDKPWKLAWYYGWHHYLNWHKDHKGLMDYYRKHNARFEKLVEIGRAEGGYMIPQKEIAKKYLEAGIFLYPSQFYEIHCISAAKAQMGGCYPITSDFAALNETVQYGTKIHTSGEKWGKDDSFGDTENVDKYLETIKNLDPETVQMEISGESEWAEETYNWDKISNNWLKIIK